MGEPETLHFSDFRLSWRVLEPQNHLFFILSDVFLSPETYYFSKYRTSGNSCLTISEKAGADKSCRLVWLNFEKWIRDQYLSKAWNGILVTWTKSLWKTLKMCWIFQAKKLRNFETKQPRNKETKQLRNQETKNPLNMPTISLKCPSDSPMVLLMIVLTCPPVFLWTAKQISLVLHCSLYLLAFYALLVA